MLPTIERKVQISSDASEGQRNRCYVEGRDSRPATKCVWKLLHERCSLTLFFPQLCS